MLARKRCQFFNRETRCTAVHNFRPRQAHVSSTDRPHECTRKSYTQHSELQMKQQVCIRTTQHKKFNVPLLTAADCRPSRDVTDFKFQFPFGMRTRTWPTKTLSESCKLWDLMIGLNSQTATSIERTERTLQSIQSQQNSNLDSFALFPHQECEIYSQGFGSHWKEHLLVSVRRDYRHLCLVHIGVLRAV